MKLHSTKFFSWPIITLSLVLHYRAFYIDVNINKTKKVSLSRNLILLPLDGKTCQIDHKMYLF